ncbi:discoidin domain-containing protein [Pseudomonas chengduensis]|nr:discoidin domain-containing protein [Pseudomonas chengduensis]MDH1865738.1 discoidin domain-containing protein [Pseudomonas chengduensis]
MAAAPYSSYRLKLLQNSQGVKNWYTISTWSMFESAYMAGADLVQSGTLTASGQYSAQAPGLAGDGNDGTYWESSDSSALPFAWLRVDLPEAVAVRGLVIKSLGSMNERPKSFVLQGLDGGEWVDLATHTDAFTTSGPGTFQALIGFGVAGLSTLEHGEQSSRILAHDWASGELIRSVVPSHDGSYLIAVDSMAPLLITHTGPPGYRPVCDGPVQPEEL